MWAEWRVTFTCSLLSSFGVATRSVHLYFVYPYPIDPFSAQVIVITHSHPPDRVGIRWLLPGLKVYHIPLATIASSATLPNFFTFLPYFRTILLREHIQLVHGHASLSSLAHEAVLHAHLLGVRTVFTDHSLFGFDDAAAILTNKLLAGALLNVDAVICVSHTGYVLLGYYFIWSGLTLLHVGERTQSSGEA
jgi:hypothetical protein